MEVSKASTESSLEVEESMLRPWTHGSFRGSVHGSSRCLHGNPQASMERASVEASSSSPDPSRSSVEASTTSVEASMEAWKLPWKHPSTSTKNTNSAGDREEDSLMMMKMMMMMMTMMMMTMMMMIMSREVYFWAQTYLAFES